jgi:hypothetical protein
MNRRGVEMMNKRMLTLGTVVVISGALMITSAFAAMSTTSAGYDALKTAHKHASQIGSLTTDAKLNVTDGGQSLVNLQSTFKFNRNNNNGSGVVHVTQNGETVTINGYKQQDQLVLKSSDNDTYYVMEQGMRGPFRDGYPNARGPARGENAERIIDALVGHNENYFSLEEGSDHTSVVKLSLHDDEIPLLVNTLGSILIKNASNDHPNRPQLPAFVPLHAPDLPRLTEDIRLSGIELTTVINSDQFIEQYDLLIQASGKDAEGEQHELELKLQLSFSEFNSTVVDEVNLTDKQVEKLEQNRKYGMHGMHGKRWR